MPQEGDGHCSCGGSGNLDGPQTASYPPVYAVGRIEWRFPTASIEKEFAQATGRVETTGLTDRQALHAVLSQRQHRYLVRQLCWVLTIAGLETYILVPHDPADYDLLVEAVRPAPSPADLDVVIGVRGPIAPSARTYSPFPPPRLPHATCCWLPKRGLARCASQARTVHS